MKSNWSGQYSTSPSKEVSPNNVEELCEVVRSISDYPSPLLAVGSLHSNSGCNIQTKGTAVSLRQFNKVVDLTSEQITVGAGMELIEVHRYLYSKGLQLPFTPEIGNATVGSAACCCLKDAALGSSTGYSTSMVEAIKMVDAIGELRFFRRGDAQWGAISSSHGLLGLIYEVTLRVEPLKVVKIDIGIKNVDDADWKQAFEHYMSAHEGIYGIFDATAGNFIFETRDIEQKSDGPNVLERLTHNMNLWCFKYFNPIIGLFERQSWSKFVRRSTISYMKFRKLVFPKGMRVYDALKPIDYSKRYPYRWDFHFWTFPLDRFIEEVLPAFREFFANFRQCHPTFDEKSFFVCYRLRKDDTALLSPSSSYDAITLDPVRPMSKSKDVHELWDKFLLEFNDFAIQYQGCCSFNQTKHVKRRHAEGAFQENWETFKAARRDYDPGNRFLSEYFVPILGEDIL